MKKENRLVLNVNGRLSLANTSVNIDKSHRTMVSITAQYFGKVN